MAELFIERLNWPEVQAAVAAGRRRAIVCAASTEQHGPHLPEATDALLGAEYARRLAVRLGDALVAPVIRPGCSEHHMAFAGTITISPSLLMDVIDAYVASLRRHGFTDFVVMSSHGGNYPILADWAVARATPGCVVISDAKVFDAGFEALRRFGREDTAGPHAEVMETSMMLRLHPELVQMERAAPGFEGDLKLPGLLERGMHAISANGIIGNPVGASAEIGEAVLDALADRLADQVRTLQGRSGAPIVGGSTKGGGP
ncbi:MAG: creatininase family protein [Chloroflexota bacterium]|nr:creatininase family protein [Chloroflexota bacterium]